MYGLYGYEVFFGGFSCVCLFFYMCIVIVKVFCGGNYEVIV